MTTEPVPTEVDAEDEYHIPPPRPSTPREARHAWAARMSDDDGWTVTTPPATSEDLPEEFRGGASRGR